MDQGGGVSELGFPKATGIITVGVCVWGGGRGLGVTLCTVVYVAKAATGEAQGFQKGAKSRVRNGCYEWCLVVCTQLPMFSYGECPDGQKTLLSVSVFEMKLTWFITYKADSEHGKLIWSPADLLCLLSFWSLTT